MIESVGGKQIEVRADGDEVVVDWTDPATGRSSDMLLIPEDAVALAELLIKYAQKAAQGASS